MAFERDALARRLAELAGRGVFLGTSSWKYPGWCGLVYEEQRYLTRNKFSEAKFNDHCLAEYAETFPTVCVDAGYYQFPRASTVEKLCAQVPAAFRFSFKVTDVITLKRFPNLPRFGTHAGTENRHFLDPDLFASAFLKPLEPHRENMGVLIFEFSQFHKADFAQGREFAAALDQFLGRLPAGWQYAVEIRNRSFLVPDYLQMLASHKVAHVFNSWTRMPALAEQVAMDGSSTADFQAARLLLEPGNTYESAVKSLQPYDRVQKPLPEVRKAAALLAARALTQPGRSSFLYVNNRLEGCSPQTIWAILNLLADKPPA